MEKIIEVFNNANARQDLVLLVPILLPWLLQHLSAYIGTERQWKIAKEKSSSEKFYDYALVMISSGLLLIVMYIFIVCAIEIIFELKITLAMIEIIYTIYSFLIYTGFFFFVKRERVVFKWRFNQEENVSTIMNKIPIIISAVIWVPVSSDKATITLKIGMAAMMIFVLIFLMVLDNEKGFKFKYATFYFYGEKEIKNIETSSIRQKGNWIIGKTETPCMEYSFRIKDIERIEYKN